MSAAELSHADADHAPLRADVAIFGAGVAGLWTALRLAGAGYGVIVLEPRAIGGVQSIASQGIIHGGLKYALDGLVSGAARSIADAPRVWRDALMGEGPVDLRGVELLSDAQWFWSTGTLAGRLALTAASGAFRADAASTLREQWPDAFRSAPKSVSLLRVEEPVLEPASVARAMAAHAERAGVVIAGNRGDAPEIEPQAGGWSIRAGESRLLVRAIVACAGAGNPRIAEACGHADLARDQRRPLRMAMARSPALPMLFGHAVGASARPKLTVTSQRDASGRVVWYLGGEPAEPEDGALRDDAIECAQRACAKLLPWVDMGDAEWATLDVDRAEPATPSRARPDGFAVHESSSGGPQFLVAWPTKLALAPFMADHIHELVANRCEPIGDSWSPDKARAALPAPPPIAKLPWEEDSLAWTADRSARPAST